MGLHIGDLEPLFPVRPDGLEPLRLFAFPGQGTQVVGMGAELYDETRGSSTFRRVADEGFDAVWREDKIDLREIVFRGTNEDLTRPSHAQPVIVILSQAYFSYLVDEVGMKVSPRDPFAGHSVGWWTACTAAGGLPLAQAARAVYWRGRFMEEQFTFDPAQGRPMAAVINASQALVEGVCLSISREGHLVVPANYNCNAPSQIVISGHSAAVAEASARLTTEKGVKVIPVPVAGPFHSPLMEPVVEPFRLKLDEIGVRRIDRTTNPIISNVTGIVMPLEAAHRDALLSGITGPVRWSDSMAHACTLGVTEMVSMEVVGNILAGLVRKVPFKVLNPRNIADLERLQGSSR